MQINSNITAIITNNALLRNESAFKLSTGKLSSGYKINTAGDDPTGYAISGRMRQQLEALKRADVNGTTGKSVLETADGALAEVTDMIQRLNELSIKASNGTMSANDRADIQNEVNQLTEEIQRISEQIELNGQKLLDGHMENHGYCENNKNVHIEEYNSMLNAGNYLVEVSEKADTPMLKLAMTVTPVKNGVPDYSRQITLGNPSNLDDPSNPSLKMPYPQYTDPEKRGRHDDQIGVAVTSSTYGGDDDPRGSVKICDDGSHYVTIKGVNGEELTIRLDKEITGQTETVYDGGYDMNTYSYHLTDLEVTITGKGAMDLHIGANEEEIITCSIPKISLERLDLDNLDMTTRESARNSIDRISHALSYVSKARSRIGAYTNRVEHSISYIAASNENLTAAMSRIQDTDMAEEMTNYASQQVLVQAATSMLAQANQAPQQALQLIQ